jgi:hypothetical protein
VKVRVTFVFEPEPEEVDEDHPGGLTDEATQRLHDQLMMLGAEDVETEAVS